MVTLKVEKRDPSVSADKIRVAGQIPAVFYGKKEASTPISISMADFLKVWKQVGESSVISLETADGIKESLIHDVAFDPVTGRPVHADFYVFEKGHKVEVEIPLEFEGESPAVKTMGGTLVKVRHALKVEAKPSDLPHNIIIDISSLVDFSSQILAKDIQIPAGVELLENLEEVVALVSAPREEKEEEVAPADLAAIEVEKKGKQEEGDDAAPADTTVAA